MLALRNRHFFLLDLILLPATAVLAFALRLDATGMQQYSGAMLLYLAVAVPVKLLVFYRFGFYRRFWRHATLSELLLIATASGVSVLVTIGVLFAVILLAGISSFPRSIPLIDGLLTPLAVGGPRFAMWMVWQTRRRARLQEKCATQKRVLVVGAGDAGSLLVKELRASPQFGLVPVGFVDDDEAKQGMEIFSLPVLGGRDCIPTLVGAYEVAQVVIALPSAPGAAIRDVLEICEQARVPVRMIPSMYDILSGLVSVNQIREVQIEDLLRRAPVDTNCLDVEHVLRGRRVLVTGAGGSIGSELCRQIARCAPKALILVGHGENSIFGIANELRRRWPALPLRQVIADVRDVDRIGQVFEDHRPEVVFHAAAHKHVPLMEENAADAVTNNVLGTQRVLDACAAHGVERMVLISSDKVVRPASVMGATKRVAELLVAEAARRTGRAYVAVRFGNVLGSRGSVVPMFQAQIARGGPVTVTHPEVRRYFMTIPEAVALVLQAGALGTGGEVFLLDMGDPVRIVDLAVDLIRLSGLRPRVRWPYGDPDVEGKGKTWDIEVLFTGLRPGEKLFEELCVDGEEPVPTLHENICAYHNGDGGPACPVDLDRAVHDLIELAHEGDGGRVRAKLREIVPEYAPPSPQAVETAAAAAARARLALSAADL